MSSCSTKICLVLFRRDTRMTQIRRKGRGTKAGRKCAKHSIPQPYCSGLGYQSKADGSDSWSQARSSSGHWKKSHQSKLLRLFNCCSVHSIPCTMKKHSCNNIHSCIYIYIYIYSFMQGWQMEQISFAPSCSKIHPSNIWLGPIKAFNWGSLVETVTIQNKFLLPHQVVKNIQAIPGSAL